MWQNGLKPKKSLKILNPKTLSSSYSVDPKPQPGTSLLVPHSMVPETFLYCPARLAGGRHSRILCCRGFSLLRSIFIITLVGPASGMWLSQASLYNILPNCESEIDSNLNRAYYGNKQLHWRPSTEIVDLLMGMPSPTTSLRPVNKLASISAASCFFSK